MEDYCDLCGHVSGTFHLQDGKWVCGHCYVEPPLAQTCRMHEFGHENPIDPKGSTAHVREIKTRRIDPKTKEVFNYSPPKTYFYT